MIIRTLASLSAFLLAGGTAYADTADAMDGKNLLGWLEFVRVSDLDIRLDAKLDSGATTSSIHAIIVSAPDRKKFDDEDEPRDIIFKVVNDKGVERTVESEITRWAAIKTKKGGVLYRPVVELELCLGGIPIEGEVTLADRGHFNYETLIGRNMLKSAGIVVDSSEIYTNKARCPK